LTGIVAVTLVVHNWHRCAEEKGIGAYSSRVASPNAFGCTKVVPEREVDFAARRELKIRLRADRSFDFRPQIFV
jgi:hypothetical protein